MSISMRLEGKVDLKKQLRLAIQAMAKDYSKELKDETPVDTGKAKRGWRLRRTNQGAKIKNSVKYIQVLEKGRVYDSEMKRMQGSTQAPEGMTKPAKKTIKEKIRAGKYKMKRRK